MVEITTAHELDPGPSLEAESSEMSLSARMWPSISGIAFASSFDGEMLLEEDPPIECWSLALANGPSSLATHRMPSERESPSKTIKNRVVNTSSFAEKCDDSHIISIVDAALRLCISSKPTQLIPDIRIIRAEQLSQLAEIAPALFSPGYLQVGFALV